MAIESFQMSGEAGQKDDQNVVSWTLSYFVEKVEEIFTVGEPPHPGLKEVGREWSDIDGIGIQVDVTYEGYVGDDPELEDPVYEFDPSFKEETLVAHPLWPEIAEFYGGRYDEEEKAVRFTPYLENSRRGLSSGNSRKIKNPLHGTETFFSLSITFRETRVYQSVPSRLLEEIGTIRDSLPGGFPTPAGRDWLVMPPRVTQRGQVYQVATELLLSPPGGWPKKVYQLIQI